MITKIALLVLSMIVLFSGVIVPASEEVTITFPRSVVGVSQHGNFLVVVNYQKAEGNEQIELTWDSASGECGRSVVSITPENNGIPVVKDLILPVGEEYIFVATLYRRDGSKAVASQTRFVTG